MGVEPSGRSRKDKFKESPEVPKRSGLGSPGGGRGKVQWGRDEVPEHVKEEARMGMVDTQREVRLTDGDGPCEEGRGDTSYTPRDPEDRRGGSPDPEEEVQRRLRLGIGGVPSDGTSWGGGCVCVGVRGSNRGGSWVVSTLGSTTVGVDR